MYDVWDALKFCSDVEHEHGLILIFFRDLWIFMVDPIEVPNSDDLG